MLKKNLILTCALVALSLTSCGGKSNTSGPDTTNQNTTPAATTTATTTKGNQTTAKLPTEIKDLFAAPNGTQNGDGSKENPYDFKTAFMTLTPGSTLFLLEGTYKFGSNQKITNYPYAEEITDLYNVDNEAGRRTIQPALDASGKEVKVVFDFSVMSFNGNNRGVSLDSNYWTLKDIELFGAGDNGVYIGGNHNIVENLDIHDCQDSGLQLGRKGSSYNSMEDWPSYNLIKNCTSHDNHDVTGEDSDGFACKLTTGVGNVFDGCIAYNNVDDGWDLYTKGESGPIGAVTIKNCIAFNNGITSAGIGTANSDGNGFKLGGESIAVSHTVENCLAFNNLATGFTDNSNPGTISFKNCTSYNNGTRDLDANNFDVCRDTATSSNSYSGLLSFCDGNRVNPITGTVAKANSRDEYKGSVDHSVFYSGLTMLKFDEAQYCDYSTKTYAGTIYTEPNGKSPFVSTVSPQPQAMKGVPASVHADIHHDLRAEDGSLKLGDFMRIDPTSAFFTMGENGSPIGADLSGGNK